MSATSAPRRFLPQLLIALVALVALSMGAVALARSLSGKSSATVALPVLHWANEGTADLITLDPAAGPDLNARTAMQLIYGGLVRFGPGFRILPDAAERWTVSPDGRTYTFYLRPNVRFGDGHALTADDVAYSLNRTLSPRFAGNSGAFLLSDIEGASAAVHGRTARVRGIRVLNAQTLRIHLARPSGAFLAKLATPAGYIVPRWRIAADPRGWQQHAVGTGPFMVDRWVHNTALYLVPNPHYYGGKLQLGGIDMPFIPEPLSAYKRYRAGSVDAMGTIQFPAEALYDVQGHPDFHQSPRLETVFLTLNERRPPFNSTLVRLAFAHAIDKNALVSGVFGNFARATNGMMPPGLPGYNPHLRGAGYDPALARRLLAQAGFPGGRGLPAVSIPIDQYTGRALLENALASQWRQVLGVRVRLVQYTHLAYLNLLQQLKYQIAIIDWTEDFPDPENFVSQQLLTGSPNNNGGWSSARFDALATRADTLAPDNSQRLLLYRQAEELAMDKAATIPLVNPTTGILLRSDVHGLQISGGFLLAQDWTRVTVASGSGR